MLTSPRTVIVAGAGIGGLTAALALAHNGFRVVVLEQAERLEETGAGIQLSPNAARILIDLGLADRLRPHAVSPTAVRVLSAASGQEIVRMTLADARAALRRAVLDDPSRRSASGSRRRRVAAPRHHRQTRRAGARFRHASQWGHRLDARRRRVDGRARHCVYRRRRSLVGHSLAPRSRSGAALRRTHRLAGSCSGAREVAPEFREPQIRLWLGRDAHLVHYPVKAGRIINVVVITGDSWNSTGWSEPASRAEIVPRLAAEAWAPAARALVGLPEAWLKWALYDRRPVRRWTHGPVALLGDAAHPMLPFLAQGAAMAIEDAAVAAQCLARSPDDPAGAMRIYCAMRRGRTSKVQRAARRNGTRYHFAGAGPGCATASCGRSAERGCCKIMIGFMTGGRRRRSTTAT